MRLTRSSWSWSTDRRSPIGSRRVRFPVEEALPIARQIAEALETAHEQGIIHRDLKPANIKLRPDGTVKVLDFGLAKAMETAPTAANLTQSPTLSMLATQAGVILGTAAYMSPEQARGFPADHRSDVFSFGCVLYEMLTGRQPFQGDTGADVLASVLKSQADLSALPADLNPRVAELLRRCLEKHPRQRWQAIGDVRVELDAIAHAPHNAFPVAASGVPLRPRWRRAVPAVVASLIVGALGATGAWFLKPSAERREVVRFAFTLGEGQRFTNGGRPLVAVSPDGTRMAYVANQRLYLRSMSEVDARPIPGSENPSGITNPVFSPDARSLAFYSLGNPGGVLKIIAVTGGAAVTVCPADNNPFGISWEGETILFGQATRAS